MKSVILLSVVLLPFIGSCQKETYNTEKVGSGLTGKWEWIRSTGGIGGYVLTPESTGRNVVIEFTSGNVFRYYLNGQLQYSYPYHLEIGSTIYGSEPTSIIKYGSSPGQSYHFGSIEIDGQTYQELVLKDECYDCYTSEYKRISQ
jgi:hypothetical protein